MAQPFKRTLPFVALLLALSCTGALCAELKPRKPGPRDKCPVCGMFVAKYADFAAQIRFRDGTVAFFDGSKDLVKYYRALSRYNPGKKTADIAALIVTDYYKMAPIDGSRAFYVVGSDVFGPMGRELISFAKEAEAREFSKDHKGKITVRFPEISDSIVRGLD